MKLAIPLLLSLAIAAPAAADDCRHTAPREVSASADGVALVEVRARAGSLVVRGVAGSGIRAFGTACSSSADLLEGIRLVSRRSGNRLIVEALVPDSRSWSFGWNMQRRLDFTVELPANLPVQIEDGSGSIEVRNVASVDIEDGSGAIDVRGVRGAVKIDDGSGSITIRDAGGPIHIDDGSGGITIRDAGGPIHIVDGSGDIEIHTIRGDVIIEEDGSGGIEIAEVTGNVVVENDGSGSISVRNVSGDFTVRHDGSGGVSVEGVRGRVSVPK